YPLELRARAHVVATIEVRDGLIVQRPRRSQRVPVDFLRRCVRGDERNRNSEHGGCLGSVEELAHWALQATIGELTGIRRWSASAEGPISTAAASSLWAHAARRARRSPGPPRKTRHAPSREGALLAPPQMPAHWVLHGARSPARPRSQQWQRSRPLAPPLFRFATWLPR